MDEAQLYTTVDCSDENTSMNIYFYKIWESLVLQVRHVQE